MIIEVLGKLEARADLSRAEAEAVMEELLSGQASDTQIVGLLAGLRSKGETVEELVGFATAMRRHAEPVFDSGRQPPEMLVDTCGTGGDASGTFNVSTAAAFVVAGAGVRVAKHGNRATSSKCGSADVLEALGVKLDVPPQRAGAAIEQVGIGFLFAPALHRAMRHAMAARRQLGGRTVFNLLGPLTNPAGARAQLLGVFAARLRTVQSYTAMPEDFGLRGAPLAAVAGGDAAENARIICAVLEGEAGPRRHIVLANAAAALVAGGRAEDFREGAAVAAQSIDSGAAHAKLRQLAAFTNQKESRVRP